MKQTIQQLGGNKFIAMVGAKNFVTSSDTIRFQFMRAPLNKANLCVITLKADDTYSLQFHKLRGINCDKVGNEITGVHAQELPATFKGATGLDVSL